MVLRRPLVLLDLETTGVNLGSDRIIEIALVKVRPDGWREVLTRRVNPGMPIPIESTRVHRITDADVTDAPSFALIAPEVLAFIGDADLAGFNIGRFDLPLLRRELAGAGHALDMTGRAVVDAQVIYHRREPRDLAAAYRFYCGSVLCDPHTARVDAEACLEVLDAQLEVYPDLPRTPADLSEYLQPRENPPVDPDGRFVWEGGEVVFAFGPDGVRGRSLRYVAEKDTGFLRWVLRKDFDPAVKAIVQDALEGKFPDRRG